MEYLYSSFGNLSKMQSVSNKKIMDGSKAMKFNVFSIGVDQKMSFLGFDRLG